MVEEADRKNIRVGIRFRILRAKLSGDGGEFGARAANRNARAQASDNIKLMGSALFDGSRIGWRLAHLVGDGNPIQRAIGGKRKFEFRRHHANNSERFEVELNLFADDAGAAAHTRLHREWLRMTSVSPSGEGPTCGVGNALVPSSGATPRIEMRSGLSTAP